MLDALAALARRRGVLVAAAVLVAIAVVGPALLGGGGDDDAAGDAGTSAPSTSASSGSTTTSTATDATTTVALPEVARGGDPPDTSLYGDEALVAGVPGDDERRADDHDRVVGGPDPVRISGYSAWVDAAERRDADAAGTAGPWLRVAVRVLNRDDGPQPYTYTDWTLVGPDGVAQQPEQASKDFADGTQLQGNGEVDGELWFRLRGEGRHWVLYRPQQDRARGVWAVDVPPA